MEKYIREVTAIIQEITGVNIDDANQCLLSHTYQIMPHDLVYVFLEIEKKMGIPIKNFYKATRNNISVRTIAEDLEQAHSFNPVN